MTEKEQFLPPPPPRNSTGVIDAADKSWPLVSVGQFFLGPHSSCLSNSKGCPHTLQVPLRSHIAGSGVMAFAFNPALGRQRQGEFSQLERLWGLDVEPGQIPSLSAQTWFSHGHFLAP